jgi:hypothetical protein
MVLYVINDKQQHANNEPRTSRTKRKDQQQHANNEPSASSTNWIEQQHGNNEPRTSRNNFYEKEREIIKKKEKL